MTVDIVKFDNVDGQDITFVYKKELQPKDGQDKICAVCNLPIYPECKNFCHHGKDLA